jgi:hypothetical protein
MKKRPLELFAVLVVVAAVVGFTRSAQSTAEVPLAESEALPPRYPVASSTTRPLGTPSLSASPIGVAAPGQTERATVLWEEPL